jgi:pimeloyl-ACP methyl ester carboxylesterase
MASRPKVSGKLSLAFLIWLLIACGQVSAGQNDEERSTRSSAVVIVSPISGFATNARTLQVNVRFDARRLEEGEGRIRQLRLWLDGTLVASYDVPRKVRQGTHSFSVDVSTRPDAMVRLEAGLVRVNVRKDGRSRQEGKEDGENDEQSGQWPPSRSPAVLVFLDKTPPLVRIVSPLNNQIVTAPSVSIQGFATDNLSGVVSLTVNGNPAAVTNGIFSAATNFSFSTNTVAVTATDRAGNSSTTQQLVVYSARRIGRPLIVSAAPTVALVDTQLLYQITAASETPGSLVFSLAGSPAGMTIDSSSGLVIWRPKPEQIGDQSVTVVATDAFGQTSQNFTLSVFRARPVASALIAAATGGVITVTDQASTINGLSINIPANALLVDTTIRVSELVAPPTIGGRSRFFLKAVSIEPDGTLLSVPATITLPYHTDEFRTGAGIPLESFLRTYLANAVTGTIEALDSFSVDAVNHVLSGSVPHFSMYVFTNGGSLCPPPTELSDCPDALSSAAPNKIPTLTVHGFHGDRRTWGSLRRLLKELDHKGEGHIDAWNFEWDSLHTLFELSAADLAEAINEVKRAHQVSKVNLVAHSFGGILVRTYLQNRGNFGRISYRGDVNRLMTLGSPYQGIGGKFSTLYATGCASALPGTVQFLTCFQTNTGNPTLPGEGVFLNQLIRDLNTNGLPGLNGHSPQYLVIKGGILNFVDALEGVGPITLQRDDGLITFEGARPCKAEDDTQGCATSMSVETMADNASAPAGLCHSSARFLGNDFFDTNCGLQTRLQRNVAMAQVDNKGHPLWQEICTFLGADPNKCKPQLNVFKNGNGTVTSVHVPDVPDINCGTVCSAGYDMPTTVILQAHEDSGYKFDGWSGDCSGQASCTITLADADKFVTATFSQTISLIGTFNVNYRYNAAGCSNDPNPYFCVGSGYGPGPYYIDAAPGRYKVKNISFGSLGPNSPHIWTGDRNGGVHLNTPSVVGGSVEFDHTHGQIVLYYWDWYAGDNDPNLSTVVELSRLP